MDYPPPYTSMAEYMAEPQSILAVPGTGSVRFPGDDYPHVSFQVAVSAHSIEGEEEWCTIKLDDGPRTSPLLEPPPPPEEQPPPSPRLPPSRHRRRPSQPRAHTYGLVVSPATHDPSGVSIILDSDSLARLESWHQETARERVSMIGEPDPTQAFYLRVRVLGSSGGRAWAMDGFVDNGAGVSCINLTLCPPELQRSLTLVAADKNLTSASGHSLNPESHGGRHRG